MYQFTLPVSSGFAYRHRAPVRFTATCNMVQKIFWILLSLCLVALPEVSCSCVFLAPPSLGKEILEFGVMDRIPVERDPD